jgi:hypothetical protein
MIQIENRFVTKNRRSIKALLRRFVLPRGLRGKSPSLENHTIRYAWLYGLGN